MRLHRFYIKEHITIGQSFVTETTENIHQWLSVFRYSTGDKVILFNGDGQEYEAEFTELHKKKAALTITSAHASMMPSKQIHLYLAAIKKDLFEFVVEKATELGVTSITPIITEHTQMKNLNMERLEKIAIEASEQSFRGTVPQIHSAVSLTDAISSANGYSIYLADMGGKTPLPLGTVVSPQGEIISEPRALFIGPEGGWGEKDRNLFKELASNSHTISLGETVLRAETAAIVGVGFMAL